MFLFATLVICEVKIIKIYNIFYALENQENQKILRNRVYFNLNPISFL